MPGMVWPVVINSTIWVKEVGYGAGGSELFVPTLGSCLVAGGRVNILLLECVGAEA